MMLHILLPPLLLSGKVLPNVSWFRRPELLQSAGLRALKNLVKSQNTDSTDVCLFPSFLLFLSPFGFWRRQKGRWSSCGAPLSVCDRKKELKDHDLLAGGWHKTKVLFNLPSNHVKSSRRALCFQKTKQPDYCKSCSMCRRDVFLRKTEM